MRRPPRRQDAHLGAYACRAWGTRLPFLSSLTFVREHTQELVDDTRYLVNSVTLPAQRETHLTLAPRPFYSAVSVIAPMVRAHLTVGRSG